MADVQHGPTVEVSFPGNKRVAAHVDGHTVTTDQPQKSGGDGSAPSPFDLVFCALASCAGYYVLEFCQSRSIPLDGIRLRQDYVRDAETRRVTDVRLVLTLPPSFPERYRGAVVKAIDGCSVKKLLQAPPQLHVDVEVGG